jgi:hypothetical protein
MSTPTILRHLGGSDPPAIIEGFVRRIALSRHVYLFAARTIQLSLLPLNLGPKLLRDPHHFFNEWFVGVLAVDVTPLVVFYTFAEEGGIVPCGGTRGAILFFPTVSGAFLDRRVVHLQVAVVALAHDPSTAIM